VGGGGGSSDSNTTIYTNLLPTYIAGIQTWAVDYLNQSAAISLTNFEPYTGTTYAPQNANELAGIAALVVRGTSGSSIEAYGEAYLATLIAGGYVSTNPFLAAIYQKQADELIQAFKEDTMPTITAAFAFGWGGSDHQAEEAKASEKAMAAINDLAVNFYYNDYVRERNLQDKGLSDVIQYGNRVNRDAEILRQAGVFEREYTQGQYTDNWKKWNEAQILPTRNLEILGNAVRTILGTTRTASVPYYKPSAFSEIAGTALTGIALYAAFKKTPISPTEEHKEKASREPNVFSVLSNKIGDSFTNAGKAISEAAKQVIQSIEQPTFTPVNRNAKEQEAGDNA